MSGLVPAPARLGRLRHHWVGAALPCLKVCHEVGGCAAKRV
jgi:hypothetical protein